MPQAQDKPDIDVHRFASVLAGFDICNGSDEEAITKGLALRRMASGAGMRIVDLLEVPEVRAAIDAQLSPKRKPDPALKEALELASALQEELTDRMRDVRTLAERLRREEEKAEELSGELRDARAAAGTVWVPPPAPQPSPAKRPPRARPAVGLFDLFITDFGFCAASLLGGLLFAWVLVHFSLGGGNGNGLGNGQGKPVGGIYETGPIPALPAPGAVRHRVHHRGPAHRDR
jgi:hypothetical protein